MEQLNDLWWIRIPALAGRRTRALAGILADGLYLSAFPVWSAWAPPLFLALGVCIGWRHPGFAREEVFTASLLVLILMVGVGALSAAWGFWLTLGYCLGDFFLYRHHAVWMLSDKIVKQLVLGRLPLLIPYCLLAFALMFIPLISQLVRRQTLGWLTLGHRIAPSLNAIVQASLHFGLVFMWTQATPSLIRPVYTWSGDLPTVQVMLPLQGRGIWVALATAAVSVTRVIVEQRVALRGSVTRRVTALGAAMAASLARQPHPPRAWVIVLFQSLLTTFVVSGLLGTWIDAIVFAAVMALVLSGRVYSKSRMSAWSRLIGRVPLILRLTLGVLVSFMLSDRIVTAMWNSSSSFRPVTISAAISLVVFFVLIPDLGRPRAKPSAHP